MSIFNTYLDAPSSRIQSCKQTIFCQDTCSTKSIQQSTLSCICVTNLEDPTNIPTERMGIRPTNSQLRRQILLATYIIPILYRLTRSFTSLSFLSRLILRKVMTLNPKLFEKRDMTMRICNIPETQQGLGQKHGGPDTVACDHVLTRALF